MQEEKDSNHTVYSINLHRLALTATDSDNVELIRTSPDSALTATYITRTVPGAATILTSWSANWVYLAINSPSSLCTVKLLRLPLSVTVSSDLPGIQTHSLPFYVPASFSTRSPKLEVVQTSAEDHIAFVLQSLTRKQALSAELHPVRDSILNSSSTGTTESTSSTFSLPPILITHPISRIGGWRGWGTDRDSKEPTLDSSSTFSDYMKGGYAAADQRFTVPIRSGLNWRKAITVSCW
jgi:hypothetical protein